MTISGHMLRMAAARRDEGPPDPYFANVSLLLHGDGSWADSAGKNTVIPVGGASISTAVKRFGAGSMHFNGSGKARVNGTNTPVAAGQDFTVEAWLYPTSFASNGLICVATPRATAGNWFFGLYQGQLFAYDEIISLFSAGTPSLNVWQHAAYTRSGTTHRLFLNGVLVGTKTGTAQAHPSTNLSIGSDTSGADTIASPFYGYIDDLRITVGVARYTAAFTPPDRPFSNR